MKTWLKPILGRSKDSDEDTGPDVTRVLGDIQTTPVSERIEAKQRQHNPTVHLGQWLRADLSRLHDTMTDALVADAPGTARDAFQAAVHDLHGASGIYGGGALTRLTDSLQTLIRNTDDWASIAPLINLHVKACHANCRGGEAAQSDELANAVCDALEKQVDKLVGIPRVVEG